MKFLILATIIVVLSGSISAQNGEKVFKLTKAANDASLQGHVEGNVDKIVAVYSNDAIILPPGGVEPIRGVAAICDYYNKGLRAGRVLKATTKNISFEVIDASHAVEVGRYTLIYQPAGAEKPAEIKGTMLINWEKNARGEWKIKVDMWH